MQQKPSIGRIVHYASHGGTRLAAIITKVINDTEVSLAVFPPGWEKPLTIEAATFATEHEVNPDPNCIDLAHGCWTWPPRV